MTKAEIEARKAYEKDLIKSGVDKEMAKDTEANGGEVHRFEVEEENN